MSTYISLIEQNEHEGETWRFWIRVEGNEEALNKLGVSLEYFGLDDLYMLDETLPEAEVDALVKNTMSGYMAFESKLDGKLTVSDDLAGFEALSDALYKGGISDLIDWSG